jgi:exonuclease SbcC
MTRIARLELRNFKSHKDTAVDFAQGKVIILGENGAGKSSIEQGISYALFGVVEGFREIKDLVGVAKPIFEVAVNFEVGGKKFRVERSNGKKGAPTASLWEYKADYAGERKVIAEDQTKVSQEILRILGAAGEYGKELRNYVVVPQNQIQTIISDKPADRKGFFDNLFGISDYENTRGRLNHMKNVLKKGLDTYAGTLDAKKTTVQELPVARGKLEVLLKDIEATRAELDKKSSEYEAKKLQYDQQSTAGRKVGELKARIAEGKCTINSLEGRRDTEYEKLAKDKTGRVPQGKGLPKDQLDKLHSSLSSEVKSLEVKVREYNATVEHLKKLEQSLEEKKKNLIKAQKDLEKVTADDKRLATELLQRVAKIPWLKPPESEWPNAIKARVETLHAQSQELATLKKKSIKLYDVANNATIQIGTIEKEIQGRVKRLEKITNTLEGTFLKGTPEKKFKENLQAAADPTMLEKLTQQDTALATDIKRLEKEGARLQQRIDTNAEILTAMRKLKVGGICSNCKQPVSETHKQEEIKILIAKDTEFKSKLVEQQAALVQVQEQYKLVQTALQDCQKAKNTLDQFVTAVTHRDETKQELDAAISQSAGLKASVDKKIMEFRALVEPHVFIKFGKSGETIMSSIESEVEVIRAEGQACNDVLTSLKASQENQSRVKGIQQDIAEITSAIKDLNKEFTEDRLKGEIEARAQAMTLQQSLTALVGRIKAHVDLIDQVMSLGEALATQRAELAKLERDFDAAFFVQLDKDVKALGELKGSLHSKLETLQDRTLPELKTNVYLLEQGVTEYNAAKASSDLYSIAAKELDYYVQFFADIQGHVRRRFVQQTSQEATQLFREMVEMPEFEEIKIDEDYNLQVFRHNEWEKLGRLSGGEKMIMSLAIRIAIASSLGKQDLILLDEPTESLDEIRIQTFVDCFERRSPLSQIFIITHDREFERVADQVIRVTKEMGHSKLEVVTE